jgi:hypothetical protein
MAIKTASSRSTHGLNDPPKQQRQAEVVSSKAIDHKLKKLRKPGKDHPWRRYACGLNGKFFTEVVQYGPAAFCD